MKKDKRIYALMLSSLMAVSAVPTMVLASETQGENNIVASGEESIFSTSTTGAAIAVQPAAVATIFSGGSGTVADPYRLTKKDDIINLGLYTAGYIALPTGVTKEYLASANYLQMNDIDMESSTNFAPICLNSNIPFSGEFDGNGYEIRNLYRGYITRAIDTDAEGLFSNTNTAILKNINLVDPLIEVNTAIAHDNVGGLVGYAYATTIENCSVVSTKNSSKIKAYNSSNVGGLVGTADGATTINNSFAKISITGVNSVGGLVGNTLYSVVNTRVTINNSYYIGDVKGENYIGGIAGGNNLKTFVDIKNCYTAGTVEGKTNVGGIIGMIYHNIGGVITIANNYSYSDLTGVTNIGGIVGGINSLTASAARETIITNNYTDCDIYVSGSNAGGIVGYANQTLSSDYVRATDNISFSRLQPVGVLQGIGSIYGFRTGVDNFSNNYVSFSSTISGADGHNNSATIAYQKDLISKEWWENTLKFNDAKAFNISLATEGYLPKLYQSGTTTYIPEQSDLEFVGNHLPTATNIIYAQSSLENQEMFLEKYGILLTSVQTLDEKGDYVNVVSGRDYQVSEAGIIFKGSFLETLPLGNTTVRLVFNSGQTIFANIEVIESIPDAPTITSTGPFEIYFGDSVRFYVDKTTLTTGLGIAQIKDLTSNSMLVNLSDYRSYLHAAAPYFRIESEYFYNNGLEVGEYELEVTFTDKSKTKVKVTYLGD